MAKLSRHQRPAKPVPGRDKRSRSLKTARKANRARGQAVEYDDTATRFVASHARELYESYPGLWILVQKDKVLKSSIDPLELQEQAAQLGIDAPFITRVAPIDSNPSATIYADKVV